MEAYSENHYSHSDDGADNKSNKSTNKQTHSTSTLLRNFVNLLNPKLANGIEHLETVQVLAGSITVTFHKTQGRFQQGHRVKGFKDFTVS